MTLEAEDQTNRLQEWVIDDSGRIGSLTFSELTLTTAAKTTTGCALAVERKEEKDAKRRQDQSFNICVLLEDGEKVEREVFFYKNVVYFTLFSMR